jgi:hypothetical protein
VIKTIIKISGKSDEDLIREFVEFENDYLSIDKDRLILLTLDYLNSKNIEATFDKLTVAAFKLFPKKFSLIGFPEYPDAKTVNDCVFLHCVKGKKWVSGNAQTGYKITEKGKYFLEEAKKILKGEIKLTKSYGTVPRRKEVTFIKMLKKTAAYKKYIQNKKENISLSEILDALRAQDKDTAKSYLEKYLEYANKINDSEAIIFLEFIKKKLEVVE